MPSPSHCFTVIRALCVVFFVFPLIGCQGSSGPQWRERLTRAQNERLHSLRHEQVASDPSATPPEHRLLANHAPPTAESQRESVFSLAAYPDELGTNVQQSASSSLDADTTRGPLPGFWETVKRDAKRMPREVWDDTVDIYTDPTNLIILLGVSGATIALRQHTDEDNADFFEKENNFGQNWRDALSFMGSPATHFVLGGLWYATGIAKQDEKTYEVGRTLIDALTINGLSTLAIKFVSNRDSPNGETFAFPSGHTSSSVTFATVMHESYGPWVGIPLFGVSALVAIERLDDGEHWVSDVVFGAAMGWIIGHTVTSGRRPEIFGGEVAPYVNSYSDVAGIAWVKTFK